MAERTDIWTDGGEGEVPGETRAVAQEPADLGFVLFVSLLVMLNLPILFFTANTRIDH